MNVAAIILARGGSKGVKDKNLQKVGGLPLVGISIQNAINAGIDNVYVSTDKNSIGSVASKYGAEVISRPDELSTDMSKSEEALLHFCEKIEHDICVFLQPTSPLLTPDFIKNGLEKMSDFDSVFSAYKKHWLPEWSENVLPINWSISDRPMRQNVSPTYVENGAFYISKRESILKTKLRYSGNIGIVEMPESQSFQVDTLEDLILCNQLFNFLKK